MNIDVSTALATLQLDPDNPQALKALSGLKPGNGAGVDPEALRLALADARRWHRERGDFELCLQLIDLELAWLSDTSRRADLLHEKGRLLSDDLLRGEAGLAAVHEALKEQPDHGPSKESSAQMSLLRGNWKPISKRYLQQAQEAESAGKDKAHAASLYVAVAELLLKYGGADVAAEGEAHLRKSMELDPGSRRSGAHLERLLREKSRWDELLVLYSQRAEVAGSREDRALAEVLAGEVSAKIGKSDESLGHFRKALEASPYESRALRPVREALTKQQAWADLTKVLETAARTKRGEQDVGLQVDLASLLWKQVADLEAAEGCFRRVRKIDPSNHQMVEFYRSYYGSKNDQAHLLQVLAQAQKSETDVDRRVAMGMEMARAAEARPQSADKAIDLWKGLLRLKPRLPEALASLKTLYTKTEKWNALLEILKEELDALPAERADDKVALLLDVVAIYRDRLNLDVMVVNTYLSVLALRPDHPDALAALSARYEAQGRWSDLIGVLGKQADAATDGAARVALHRRIATLWADKLGKHGNAVASLEKILEADPRDAETSARLKDLYAKSRAWRQLLDVYRRELPFFEGEALRPRLTEMARVAGERLNDVREAITLWNQVLALAPRDVDALAGLATLYERERRWPALVEILERQRQNAEGNATAELVLLERRGMLLYEKLGATDGAIDVFRRIQALQPQNARAQRALREIYAQSGDFASLETMYVEQGAFSDLCDQLTSLADRTADMGARTRLLERVASLSIEKLNQPERALKAYERILTTDPQNRRAALALVPLYRQAQKWPRLLATYEALLGPAAADGGTLAEKLDLLAEARLICEQRLGSKGLAFQWAARAFEAAPKNEAVRTDLERVAGDADEWGPLAALYVKRADATTDAEERLWLLRRALRVNSTRLYKPLEARVFAERILTEVGHDDEAEAALEQIFTQTKAWPELAKLLHVRADRAPDIGVRVGQLFRIAQLEEERVGDAAAAARTLEAIVEAEPANDRALKALARVAEARQDWAGLVEALERDLAVRGAQGDGREELLLRIGQIQETRLGDDGATLASYRDVLLANPQSAAAVAGLERLAAAGKVTTPELRAEIATLCLPHYERTDSAAKLAGAHEALLAVADTRGEKVERLERLRGLYAGPLGDAPAAYRTGMELFALDPSDADNRGQLVGYAEAAGKTAELVGKVREIASVTEDAILRRDLLVTVAELQEQRLGNAGDAEKAYVEILSVEPLNLGAFNALTRIYKNAQRWADLRALLDLRQGATLEPRERLDLLAEIASLDEAGLADISHAITTYEKMLELDPADMRAHRALDRHYATAERWRDLEELLGTRRSFASAAEVSELEFRRADLRATRFGDLDGALDLLEEIVSAAPSHEGARRLLEKLLSSADHRQRVARVLEPLYEAGGAWARLVAVLEVRREALGEAGPEAASLLGRIADLQENKLQARANALATWRQVLAADPNNPDALPEIERIATTLERFSELVDVYQELAFKLEASDISGRADLLSRAAKLYAGRLGNRRAAIDAWKLVLGLDAENPETGRPAAAALETLYAETGDMAALVKILRVQAGWADGAEERKALLFRIAGLEEKSLADPQAAVATLRSILEIDPQDQTAIAGLEQIFEAGAHHSQRVEMLRKRIDLARDPAARQELWRRVAGLLEKDVGDVEEAIAACVAILDESPEDGSALETLSRLYAQQGRHRDNLEILERRLALAQAPSAAAARAELLRQVAALLEGPLGDPTAALERWREVLAAAPGDASATSALERFLQPAVDAELRLTAAQALEPLYERAGRFAELAGVVQVYVDGADDARTRLEQRIRLATLQEARLRDPEAAFRTTALAIRDALSEPELATLLDTYERLAGTARGAEVAGLYRELSPDVLDEAVKLRLDRFIAEAARGTGDLAGAADYYRRVLDRLPEDEAALAALDRIYRETNDAQALVEILSRRADLARDVKNDAAAEQRFRGQLGQLAEAPLGRLDDAIAAYERVLELAPADREARESLDRLYTQTERWTDLVRFLEDTLTRGRLAERDVVGIRFRLAQIEHDNQLDRESAIGHLRVVLQGDPDHPGAIAMLEGMLDDVAVQGAAAELLEPVYAGRGDWPQLIKIGEIRLLQVEDPAERVAWTKRIARLFEEQLEDYDSALRWYGKVFQEAPTERQSAEPLLRLADKLGRWQDVGALFAGYAADELSDEPAVLEVVRRTAEIFDLRLGDQAEARKHYRRLFDALPDDRAVAQLYEAALERWEAWADLRELVDEQAGRTIDAIAKLTLLRRSAKLDEERLGNRSRAIGTLQEAAEIDPTDRSTDAELERLLSAEELWHDLGDHLAIVLTRVTNPADQEAVALRLADVLETKIGDVSAAIDRYAEILERSPGRREAIAALERIAADPDHRHRVAVVLEPVYRGAGDRGKLVGALEAQLETIDDHDQRVAILREMADNYQRLGRLDLAFDCRARAWLVDVSSADTLGEMETLAVSARQYGPLVATLQQGAVEAVDPELQGQLWGISARLAEEHLGDVPQAIEAWRSALAARPDDVDAFLALERLLSQAARPAELVEVLEKHAEITLDATEKKALTKRVAVLYEDALKQRDPALRAWEAVLELDANDVEALDALAQLHLAGSSFRDLAEILERKLQLVEIPAHRRALRLELARLYDEKLQEADQAVAHLRTVVEDSAGGSPRLEDSAGGSSQPDEAAGDREALAALDAIFTRDERHADLLEVLDARAASEASPAARDDLALRAARLTEVELSDVEGGIARYQKILAASPQNPGAREALATIARGPDYRLPAVAALEPVLRAARDWAGVVELLELRLAIEDAASARIDTLAEIARIEELERRDTGRAFDAWARALTEEATASAPREALERLAATTGDFAGLARVYAERIDATFDASLQRSLALRLADLFESQLGDLSKAADYLRQALSLPGDEAAALASLERVLRRQDAHGELAEILSREAEVATEPAAQAEFLAALGELRLRALDDAEGALASFRDALERSPDHAGARGALLELLERAETREGALEILEPLAEARGDNEELLGLYEYRVGLRDDPSERAHWLRKIAEVCDSRLEDAARALDALGRALKEEPMPGAALDDLERIAGVAKMAHAGAARIEAVLPGAEPDAARELALRAARLYETAPADLGGAERLYQQVLASDAENADALGALETLYRSAGAPAVAHLASILERRAALELDPQARKRRLGEAARLHEQRGDIPAAIAAWQTLRAAEEGDAEALAELARLHEAAGQTSELVGALAEHARFAEAPAERAALWARVGALRLKQDDVDGAAEAYREALEGAPEDASVLGALEGIEERREDWATLQEVLMRRLGAATGAAQVPVLLKLAKNAETRLDDLEQASGYLRQMLEVEPANGSAYLELERLLRVGERWYDLVDVLGNHAELEGKAGRKPTELALRVAIADVWERELSSPESAVEALEKVLEVDPSNVAALLSMARIHEGAERWDEAGAALERAALSASSGAEAAEIHFRNAQILRAKEAPAEEIEVLLLRALDASPEHVPTLEALEALARTAKDDERLVQLLELRLEASASAKPDVQRKLLSEIAGLYKKLGRGGQAVPVLERLVAVAPDEIGGREDLADALIAAGRTDEAVAIARDLIEQLTKARRGKEAARWYQRLGTIAIADGDLPAASEHFNAAYKLDPAHPLTLSALGRLAFERGDHETARKFYRSLLLQSFDEATTGVSKADVYLMLGRMHVTAQEIPKARNMFERGLETDPKNEMLKQALAQLPRN